VNELRRRLLVQHLLITAVIILAGEAALYGLVRRSNAERLRTTVHKQIEKINSLIELEPDFPEFYDTRVDELRLDDLALSWQVILPDGKILGHSRDLAGDRLLPEVGGALPTDRPTLAEVEVLYLGRALVGRMRVSKPRLEKRGREITMPASMTFDIRVAARTAETEESARRLLGFLAIGFPVVLGLAGLAAHRLIGRALRPVELALRRERRFAGAASHQLRTPLTALRGEIDVALRRPRSAEELTSVLKRLSLTATHMTKVVESLLTLARVEAGNLLLGSGEVDAGALVEGVGEALAMLPQAARVRIEDELDRAARVEGDRVLIVQAIRNLVENALVHGGEGTVEVRLRTQQGELEVEVADGGAGFPDWVRRGEPSDDGEAPARFGLALARAVIAAHGGALVLENGPAGGIARIRLPVVG
jgi:signal transduction histidine kinase